MARPAKNFTRELCGPSASTRNFAHFAQKRRHREPLDEDRKRDDGETDGNDILALRELGWKAQDQSKCYRTSQATPKQDVLMFHRDAMRRTRKKKAARIDSNSPAQCHYGDRDNPRKPNPNEILMDFVHPDQKEYQRVRNEGGVISTRWSLVFPDSRSAPRATAPPHKTPPPIVLRSATTISSDVNR